jgi:hypothetical protein
MSQTKGSKVMMKQKEAVFQAITNVVGSFDGSVVLSTEARAQVHMILVEGFKSGDIALGTEYDEADLNIYVTGLIGNYLRKDSRLNGGVKYQPKNPGSRTGQGDETLKAIRALKSTITSEDSRWEDVCNAEATRLSEIQAAKKSTVAKVINFDALPAELAMKFQSK